MSDEKTKTYDGRGVLAKVSGLKPEVVNEIWEAVKANTFRLAACAGPHRFQAIIDDPKRPEFYRKMRCSKCAGELDRVQAHWYNRGLDHGQAQKT